MSSVHHVGLFNLVLCTTHLCQTELFSIYHQFAIGQQTLVDQAGALMMSGPAVSRHLPVAA